MSLQEIKKINFHIISHSHWDREWYLPFETFRVELIELVDSLLNILEHNSDFIFHLDGYTLLLQDYLEIKPQNRELIKKYVKSGNLLVGPWYVLSDEFLTSGESTIRNLLYGTSDAKELGAVMNVGYLPDQFGHIAQLPQILKGFDIDSAVFARGIQDGIAEHIWHGLNNDSTLAISLTHWYGNAQQIPTSKSELDRYLTEASKKQGKTTLSKNLLLMNGCDHIFPQEKLSEALKAYNGDWSLKHENLPSAIKKIKDSTDLNSLPVRYGELRDDNDKFILASTHSSRVYLKLQNYSLQTTLEKELEPLSSLLLATNKGAYPFNEIKYAWKLLIQNHAHDSICGCSVDEVHREMEVRNEKVFEFTNKLQKNLLDKLGKNNKNFTDLSKNNFYICNFSNYERSEIVEVTLELPLSDYGRDPGEEPKINKEEVYISEVLDLKNNKTISFKVANSSNELKMEMFRNEVPLLRWVKKVTLLIDTNIEPFSIKSFSFKTTNTLKENKIKKTSTNLFENNFYKLEINKNGTVSILEKESRLNLKDLHYYSLEEDLGDTYRFIKGKSETTYKDKEWEVETIEENEFRKIFKVSSKSISNTDIESTITCYSNLRRIDFKTKIDNKNKNKRLRLHFPTGLKTSFITADTQFGIINRARPPVTFKDYAFVQPLHNWIAHTNNNGGLGFLGNGLSEYELYEDGNGFAVTLIRSIGKLSIVKSHSLIETPEAQCNRKLIFNYSLIPSANNNIYCHEQVKAQSKLISHQSESTVSLDCQIKFSEELILSCLKRSEAHNNLIVVRLFNPTKNTLDKCYLETNFKNKGVFSLNLNEETKNEIKKSINRVDFIARPFEIITFGIEI